MKDLFVIKNDKRFCILFLFLLASLFFAFYTSVFLPQRMDLWEKRKEFEKLKREITIFENVIKREYKRESLGNIYLNKIQTVKKMLPDTLKINEFIASLQKVADKNKVKIIKIISDNSVEQKDYFFQELTVETVCGFYELLNFLSDIENGERFVNIINTKVKKEEKQYNVLYCTYKMRIYSKGKKSSIRYE